MGYTYNTSMDATSKLLKPREAAQRLRVTNETLRSWARQGKIAYMRLPGGHHRYDLRLLETRVSKGEGDTVSPLRKAYASETTNC